MKVEFVMEKKKTNIEGREVEYYVLRKGLINGDVLELPVKKDKASLLAMQAVIEKQNNK